MSDETELALTQNWLALTHEAIWVYGLIGARISTLAEPAAQQVAAHRTARDRLSDRVTSLDGRPVETEAAYDVADPTRPEDARSLARDVESRIAATCVRLVAVTTDDARERAIRGLRTSALAQLRWGGSPEPFPGLD